MTTTDERIPHVELRPYARFDLGLRVSLAESMWHGLVSSQVLFGGLPAAAPGMVLGFKERRNEHKDRLDVAWMQGIFAQRSGASRLGSPA